MKNINEKVLAYLNISAIAFSFADTIEWFLRVLAIIITIVIALPKFEETIRKYHKRFFGDKIK